MRADGGDLLLHFHVDAMAARAHATACPKPASFSSASGPSGFPPPAASSKRGVALPRRGSGDGEAAGVDGSYLGAEAAALLLACVTATLLVLPLLLPPLPPPPPLFLLVPVAIFAVLLLLVLVPSDAAARVGPPSSSSSYS